MRFADEGRVIWRGIVGSRDGEADRAVMTGCCRGAGIVPWRSCIVRAIAVVYPHIVH